jgi:hypothetical protein
MNCTSQETIRVVQFIDSWSRVQQLRPLGTLIPLTKSVFQRSQDVISILSTQGYTIYKYIPEQ